jgi:hypothetical protein
MNKEIVDIVDNKPIMLMNNIAERKLKRFFFNDAACQLLNINENTELSFLLLEDKIFIVDTTNIDKDQFGICKKLCNNFNKTKVNLDIEWKKFGFKTFTNPSLFDTIIEECELSIKDYNLFLIDKMDDKQDKDFVDLLKRLNIQDIFQIFFIKSINSLSGMGLGRPQRKKRVSLEDLGVSLEDIDSWKNFVTYSSPGIINYPEQYKKDAEKEYITLTSSTNS